MRKIHAPLFAGAERALGEIFGSGYLADKVIQRHMQAERRWGSHDRRLFAEITYGCVRWRRRLNCALGTNDAPWAAVVAAYCVLNAIEIEAKIQLPRLDADDLRRRWEDPQLKRAERESLPDWLDRYGARVLGDRWDGILTILNQTAPVYLRANRLKTTAASLVTELGRENISARLDSGDALKLDKRVNVHATKSFLSGLFEVQDLHSQRVGLALDPQPGERVIDACAGGGGKSLHLAALMKNRGRILAMDVVDKKLEELKRRAKRAGASLIETRVIEGTKTIKRLRESADRLLLDVPCTGFGVWRRNPDAKWRLSEESIARVGNLQRDILNQYPSMVKPGGTLVYSTCSILPGENQERLHAWLGGEGARWTLQSETTLWPEEDGPDGFYIAKLKRLT